MTVEELLAAIIFGGLGFLFAEFVLPRIDKFFQEYIAWESGGDLEWLKEYQKKQNEEREKKNDGS